VILNGIEDIVARPDLADRAVFLTLEPIPEERRRPEAELWAAFEAERPRILGVLLDSRSRNACLRHLSAPFLLDRKTRRARPLGAACCVLGGA
jgi:hypothetical protein